MKDEAIEEIREVRHRISAECGHEIDRYLVHLAEVAAQHPEQVARFRELERERLEAEHSLRVAEEP